VIGDFLPSANYEGNQRHKNIRYHKQADMLLLCDLATKLKLLMRPELVADEDLRQSSWITGKRDPINTAIGG
jgi:hypothetical protein